MSTKLGDIDLNAVIVKEDRRIIVPDMENTFINENLILTPLYKKIIIDGKTPGYKFFPFSDLRTECYCNNCKSRRIFSFENSEYARISMSVSDINQIYIGDILKYRNLDYFKITALADCNHELVIIFKVFDENTIIKVGQFPSIYDMNEEINNKDFLKLLDKEYREYYKTACSLYSYNSCIGAMTYLRRIFEKLLTDTFNENIAKLKITYDDFKGQRIEDKIKTIKDYLPSIMHENGFNKVYTKISDGIHNLTEEECANMFLTLKCGIEEILTEKLSLQEKIKRHEDLSKKLQTF